jgi:hypothetical protein
MPWFKTLTKQKAGDPITARSLRETAEVAEWAGKIRAESPLAVISSGAGPLLRLAGPLFGAYVGVTNGTISARSGSTPGSGNVTIQTWNGTALASLNIDVPVLYISSTTGGLASGVYVILLKIYGRYWIIAVDCANP